ncbi:uncharacterized protein LOC102457628 isoform X4 [Pelodiscus sinensis]|uniref:uncharacterized protein LOC102457628 isoform X4 n=1 Tax=Pelodiscus sinensis TaxID=13735 RepID=UPI003F6A57AA
METRPPDAGVSRRREAGTESRRRQQGPTCSRLAGGSPSTGHCSLGTTLLLAWLSVGWGLCSTQGTASRSPAFGLDPPSRQRRQLGRGEWTPWGGWSACSSTCGDGASFRTRKCIRFLEEESCAGEPRQYRVCKRHECPASTVPFRAMQCSLYDGKPILGSQARYRWVPFHGAPNLCDLNCLAVGHNFYYTFGRVLDGTRCSLDSPGLCISGQCLVGPTAAAGHGACGRPGLVPKGLTSPWRRGMLARAWALPASQPLISGGVGGGVPALAVQGGASVPGAAPARQGYWGQPPAPPLMLHFPPDRGLRRDPGLWGWERRLRPVRRAERVLPLRAEGVPGRAPLLRFLWVQERDEDPGRGDAHQGHRPEPQLPSTSLTWAAPLSPSAALMTGEQRYVINGDWAIDWPGAYEVAGTTVRYARNADNHETLEAAGPTAEDLHVMGAAAGARRPRGSPSASGTTARVTLCSGPGSWPSGRWGRRRATTSRCSTPTATASRWCTGSTCGSPTPATAPRSWSAASTCSWPGATSTTSTRSTASCCRAAATPGPGRRGRTRCCGTSPGAAPRAGRRDRGSPAAHGAGGDPEQNVFHLRREKVRGNIGPFHPALGGAYLGPLQH